MGAGEMTSEQEARRIIQKIRRQVLLLNRKWAEINQRSNEWQHRIDETLEVCSGGKCVKILIVDSVYVEEGGEEWNYGKLLNRKWAEINHRSNEWQHCIDETLEVCSSIIHKLFDSELFAFF